MQLKNDYLATTPFDLYELSLFHLVVKQGSFTKAGELAGLTQSAITRQIQSMELSLGLKLLERTTRRVTATPAGVFLLQESSHLLGGVDSILERLRVEFAGAPKQVRVGVSQTIGLSYLPGFFFANRKKSPFVTYTVAHQPSESIIKALEDRDLDVGVFSLPPQLPKTLQITHRFQDAFTFIAPKQVPPPSVNRKVVSREWLENQNWLLIGEKSATGRKMDAWLKQQGYKISPIMRLDNFDLIINLVALGMGASLVPIRTLALYPNKKSIQRIASSKRFTRELVIVIRRQRKPLAHVTDFVENILF